VLLAGILLKLGTYGLLRFGVGLFLDAWVTLAPWLATIAAYQRPLPGQLRYCPKGYEK
jgi:NADH:ubiquinone oxidoreductase subunit 4 (subunit M)